MFSHWVPYTFIGYEHFVMDKRKKRMHQCLALDVDDRLTYV